MDLRLFKEDDLFNATLTFFRDTIGLQLQTKSKMPIDLESQFETFGIKSKKVEEVWSHVDKTYYIGLLDDDNFEKEIAKQEKSDLQEDLEDVEQSDDEYPGILIFAVDMNDGFNPTRANLTEINRTLNRFSQRVPALVLARYGNKISLMLADRVAFKQEWREGEKVRKVSLLRDIDLDKPHAGHLRILKDLVVPTSGTKKVESFDGLYKYWKEVLDTSELNKKFYQDLSNWYFWANKHVRFPDEPTAEDAHKQDKELDDMLQEHRATNVIRLLTRLLFVWFIKEKGLIPEELFDLKTLQQDILKEITPYHETGMFKEANKESIYYKAILQNLFFATLNCPIEASSADDRKRGFRSTTRGVHFGVTYLMRYERYFKQKEKFLDLVNSKVPFLNGGLFECLDERGAKEDKEDRVWVDGFSDNLPKEHKLIVPDFLFFGVEEEVDLSEDYGLKSKKYKEAAVRGLFNIFNSYKFTITENTPIEEDVALDPELLGKVFENLLASYNPETKTTARKQTGSFYTPREIVNYMVDESLIAYLKNTIDGWGVSEEKLNEKLHQLTSYEETVPFEGNNELHREIITALSNCTILDPACGSGAFPMGILQKMVHILQKLDTENEVWKEVQKEKASKEADRAISEITNKEERGQRLQEINEAFDERMNAPDYARKLFLIENCIYGVDIQPVATQISKLRFFISLVVEQKVGDEKSDNFSIRPLPNLETKFVTANTLIEIKDNSNQTSLYETDKIKKLEANLKRVRSKLFGARTTDTKYKYRQEDEELRNEIAIELKKSGWLSNSADMLAKWDPYAQNLSAPFFNSEWMFDVKDGFNIVIGNPPYIRKTSLPEADKKYYDEKYKSTHGQYDIYILFIERAFNLLKDKVGILSYINPNNFMISDYGTKMREIILDHKKILNVLDVSQHNIFVSASTYPAVFTFQNNSSNDYKFITYHHTNIQFIDENLVLNKPFYFKKTDFVNDSNKRLILSINRKFLPIIRKMEKNRTIGHYFDTKRGEPNSKINFVQNGLPALKSKDVKQENTNPSEKVAFKNKDKYRAEHYLESNYIILPRTVTQIFSSRSNNNIILDRIYYLVRRREINFDLVELIINSKAINYWFSSVYDCTRVGGGYFDLNGDQIKSIPIPLINDEELISDINALPCEFTKIKEAVVLELFFKEHLFDKKLSVIDLIRDDMESIIKTNNYLSLNESEKAKVTGNLLARWSDPENEVHKRINSFPEKSPDILKPILEG